MNPVTLRITWAELLGTKPNDMSDDLRRQRWNEWIQICSSESADYATSTFKDYSDAWLDTSGCEGCIHLDGNWCKLQELPATVNPYLTLKHGGGPGMACMGGGKETIGQQELELLLL